MNSSSPVRSFAEVVRLEHVLEVGTQISRVYSDPSCTTMVSCYAGVVLKCVGFKTYIISWSTDFFFPCSMIKSDQTTITDSNVVSAASTDEVVAVLMKLYFDKVSNRTPIESESAQAES
jgi:hypothetical protein